MNSINESVELSSPSCSTTSSGDSTSSSNNDLCNFVVYTIPMHWSTFTRLLQARILHQVLLPIATHAACHPVVYIIFISLLSTSCFVIGLSTNFYYEKDEMTIFAPFRSRTRQDWEWRKDFKLFGGSQRKRRDFMFGIHDESGRNVLSLESIHQIFDVLDVVRNTTITTTTPNGSTLLLSYYDVCAVIADNDDNGIDDDDDDVDPAAELEPLAQARTKNLFQKKKKKNKQKTCKITSVTRFWKHDRAKFEEEIQTVEDLRRALSVEFFPDGGFVDTESLLGNPQIVNNVVVSAQMLNVVIGITKNQYTEQLEKNLLKKLLSLRQQWIQKEDTSNDKTIMMMESTTTQLRSRPVELVAAGNSSNTSNSSSSSNDDNNAVIKYRLEVLAKNSQSTELQRAIWNDLPLIPIAFCIMCAFTCLVFLNYKDPVRSRCILGIGSVITIGLSLMTGFGIVFMMGIPFTNLTMILPFIIFGIGLDDTFIITGSYFRTTTSSTTTTTTTSTTTTTTFTNNNNTNRNNTSETRLFSSSSLVNDEHDNINHRANLSCSTRCSSNSSGASHDDFGKNNKLMLYKNEPLSPATTGVIKTNGMMISSNINDTIIIHRIQQTMNDIGISITVTTITTSLAFAFGCMSSVPAIYWLCLYAIPMVLIDFLYQISFFIALLVLDERRIQQTRFDFGFCCFKRNSKQRKKKKIVREDDTILIERVRNSVSYHDCSNHHHEDSNFDDNYGKIIDNNNNNDLFHDEEPTENIPRQQSHRRLRQQQQHQERRQRVLSQRKQQQQQQESPHMSERFMLWYADVLLRPWMKILVLVSFGTLLVSCIYSTLQLTQEFKVTDLLPKDSYLIGTLHALKEYNTRKFAAYVYFRNVDQMDPDVQDQMLQYIDDLQSIQQYNGNIAANSSSVDDTSNNNNNNNTTRMLSSLFKGLPFGKDQNPPYCWVRDFRYLINDRMYKIFLGINDNMSYKEKIDQVLSMPLIQEIYGNTIARDPVTNEIIASRCLLFIKDKDFDLDVVQDQIDLFHAQQQITAQQPINNKKGNNKNDQNWSSFIYHELFLMWEFYSIHVQELIMTTILASITVVIVGFIFMPHYSAIFFLIPMISILYVELIGVIQMAGLHMNVITFVTLVTSIGLLVDFIMHILLRYYESTEQTRHGRVKDALNTMGSSILIGGISTFLGVIPLALSTSAIIETVFICFLAMVLLGVSHGLILMPVLLSIFAPVDINNHNSSSVCKISASAASCFDDDDDDASLIYKSKHKRIDSDDRSSDRTMNWTTEKTTTTVAAAAATTTATATTPAMPAMHKTKWNEGSTTVELIGYDSTHVFSNTAETKSFSTPMDNATRSTKLEQLPSFFCDEEGEAEQDDDELSDIYWDCLSE